jgi:hypothetical protein
MVEGWTGREWNGGRSRQGEGVSPFITGPEKRKGITFEILSIKCEHLNY